MKKILINKWNQALIPKAILLFLSIAFALTFLKINTYKSTIDLLGFIAIGVLLVFGGIFLNYLLSKGKNSNGEINPNLQIKKKNTSI